MDKHELIYNELLTKIEDGSLSEGTRLPTEVELCRQYGVSRITAMRAVKDLQNAGLVRRVAGRGSFVERRQLRNQRPFHLLIPYVSNRFYSRMASEFGEFFIKCRRPYSVVMCGYDREFTGVMLDSIVAAGSSGLAIVPEGKPEVDAELAERLSAMQFPVVIGNRELAGISCPQVVVDEEAAGAIAAGYLADLGHRRFFYVGPSGRVAYRTSVIRYKGALTKLRERGLPEPEVLESADSIAMPWIRELFARDERPTAVITADEHHAAKIYDILKALGLKVGAELAMVSLDGGLIGLSMETPLTSVKFPGAEIGRRMAEILLELDARGLQRGDSSELRLMPQLVVRASCGEGDKVYRHEYLRELLRD